MRKKLIVLGVLFTLLTAGSMLRSDPSRSTKGATVLVRLFFEGAGKFYIFLVDEQIFKTPLTGIKKMVVQPNGAQREKGVMTIAFKDVPHGVYGIRCYQDKNGNGTLDRGLFGPSEPWGMSFRNGRPWGRPKFKQIAFDVNSSTTRVRVTVE